MGLQKGNLMRAISNTLGNRKVILKKSLKIIILAVSIFISVYIGIIISENYFFDKLYYDKSARFGYDDNFMGVIYEDKQNRLVSSRLSDLISLIELEENRQDDSKVLGVEDEGTYNIAVIGDSFVYGSGVKTDEVFTRILEKKLKNVRDVKVYNLGLPGSNIVDIYTLFLLTQKHLNIDLYVIGFVEDDLLYFGRHRGYPRYPQEEKVYSELVAQCTKDPFEYLTKGEDDWSKVIINGLYPSFSDDYSNVCVLSNITSEISQKNSIFFNLNTSGVDDYVNNFNEYMSESSQKKKFIIYKYAKIIQDNGGYLIDPHRFDGYYYEAVSEGEGHSSKKNHQLQAEILYEIITKNPAFGFPEQI